VAAPPQEGHRSDTGDHDRGGALRPTVELEPQIKLRCSKMPSRSASSPRIFQDGLRQRLSTETSSVSPIPASICEGERRFAVDSKPSGSITSTQSTSLTLRFSWYSPRTLSWPQPATTNFSEARVSWAFAEMSEREGKMYGARVSVATRSFL
jgi:hypothetical protein